MRHAKQAGTVPAGLLRWARDVLAPRVDWRRLLAAELRRAIADVAGAADYSYRRPSRRAAAVSGVVLPALRRPVPELAVVCDTSGSMSEELLAMALAEVEGLLRALGMARQLRVLACDAAAGPAQRVSSARQVTLTGGGGTNMGAGPRGGLRAPAPPRRGRGAHRRLYAVARCRAEGDAGGGRAARRRRAGSAALGKSRPRTLSWVSKAIPPRTMTVIAVLLTFASGASDVTSFTRLGNVFTSVMTGNITVFGLSLARGSASLALHTALAFAGYVAGVAACTLIGRYRTDRTSAKSPAEPGGEHWPAHMTLTLAAELALLTGVLVGWEVTGSRPAAGPST